MSGRAFSPFLLAAAGLLLLPGAPALAQTDPPPRLPGNPAAAPAPTRVAARPQAPRPLRLPGSSLPRREPHRTPPPAPPDPAPVVARSAPPPPPTPDAAAGDDLSIARQLGLGVSRIVIDAGHGGRDPGASANGLREADVVLDIARRVAERLAAEPGVEVVMTRNDDTFVPLRERTALANEVGADLFLSIHANASRNAQAHGVETYFLDFALDAEAERVAARENLAAGGRMKDLENLLEQIAANSKLRESRHFAGMVQNAMVTELRPANDTLRDLGVKQAPFFVLIGAHMPSVLAEVSFVTNRREAELLATDAYRERIADALFDGVLRYRAALDAAPRATDQQN